MISWPATLATGVTHDRDFLAVDQNGAGSALCESAAKLRTD